MVYTELLWKVVGMMQTTEWECAVRFCLRRVATWKTPPNWSHHDWMEEMLAEAEAASWKAYMDCRSEDPRRRFWCAYQHAINACLQRYRQEWRYASHCVACGETVSSHDGTGELNHTIQLALTCLPPRDQRLLRAVFWEGYTEAEIAREESVSVQAISKRKRAALKRLARILLPPVRHG